MKLTAEVNAPAKLNLYLDVTGKRGDNYHDIESVMQSISISDRVTVSIDKNDPSDTVKITCTDEKIPTGKENICYKAVKAYFDYTLVKPCAVEIHIEKNIPSQAGMGGGSADAAAVIAALNRLFDTFCDAEELCNICYHTGADVSACLLGGTQYCTGRGDNIVHLPDIPECAFVIGKGTHGISTAEAYKKIDASESFLREDVRSSFCSSDIKVIAENCANIFETVTDIPEIARIKEIILDAGALCACMTGSGSAVFGIFEDIKAARSAASTLRNLGFYGEAASPEKMGASLIGVC